MLQNLHVKNLALIDETEVDFRNGLNILSGENRCGKINYHWFYQSGVRGKKYRRRCFVKMRIMRWWSFIFL